MSIRTVIIWTLTISLVLFFIAAGFSKLSSARHIVENFEAQGLSMTFMFVIGALEIGGAIGLLFKKYARYFGLVLAAITAFTAVSSARAQIWEAVIAAVVVLILTLTLTYLRWGETTTNISTSSAQDLGRGSTLRHDG